MPTCEGETIHPNIESSVGTVIVRSDDTDIVRTLNVPFEGQSVEIHQLRDGSFLWPANLPVYRPAQTLTVAENVQKWGTGAINVDGCRVGTEDNTGRKPAECKESKDKGTNFSACAKTGSVTDDWKKGR